MSRPFASISVDLDDLWAYQRTHGDPAWQELRSYLSLAVPRMLDALDEVGCKATVFIVGADAARPDADRVLGPIAARGHEVGNHSFGHEVWLHRSEPAIIAAELCRADEAIRAATGRQPVGFRGPGFGWSAAVLEAVADRGYLFDASTLPTFLGPVARTRLLRGARLSRAERALRADLFGSARDAFRPVRPYQWRLQDGRRLLEIPVTTVPFVRVPFHQSYLVYLASFSRRVALGYLRSALGACRAVGVQPSFLLHPLDWLGREEVSGLRFFPGMGLSAQAKARLLRDALRVIGESFAYEPIGVQAARLLTAGGLPARMMPAAGPAWAGPVHASAGPEAPLRRKEGGSP